MDERKERLAKTMANESRMIITEQIGVNCYQTNNPEVKSYTGEVRGNLPHGVGVVEYKNGAIYKGDLKEGVLSGFGRMLGDEFDYEGYFRHGIRDGAGVVKNKQGKIIEECHYEFGSNIKAKTASKGGVKV